MFDTYGAQASHRKPFGTSSKRLRNVPTSRISLRMTCVAMPRLCHLAGGELDQIQSLLGHASVQTTEHYLGCKQKLRHAVNDNLGLEDV
jgi:integrase